MARQVRRGPAPRAALVTAVVAVLVAPVAVAAAALPGAPPVGAQGCRPRLVVSRTDGLAPGGETVTVSGSCYDVTKGVYVAFCVVPPTGSVPSPCGGGVDTTGANGLSHWISSNPPPQGVGLTTPYGPGGSFTVTMRPSAQLNGTVDCRRVRCAVVTRNDHTRTSDRSQDVIVPVTFAADPTPATAAPAAPAAPSAAPTTTAPVPEETTTTSAPEDTTTTTSEEATAATARPDEGTGQAEELAVDPASADGGSGAGALLAVGAVGLAVIVAAGGGAGWYAVRRRGAADEASS